MKKHRNQNEKLDRAIAELELQRDLKFVELKQQLSLTYESVKPINILNQSLVDFKESTEVKSNLLQSVLSIAGGYISKKLLVGKSHSTFKKIMGYVVQYGVTNFISKKVDPNQ
ncbi:hypothetical protein FLGE108171_05295 [Flavobacterium gelidilacus]|jgi:hypothetical protein|uniref:hypothetical protein n=1 Tax=Flavobacterium gelidilacus TaxID=206041 RepID=UPI0004013B05|nr:hypothetical protein [Flavobacterium gelidilacus]